MKDTTEALLAEIAAAHDWEEGQTYGGSGTRLSQTATCRACGMVRKWFSDTQNGVKDSYSFLAPDGTEISLRAAVARGCA